MAEVLVVGGGISGLGTAWSLRNRGHRVTVLEANSEAGGTMQDIVKLNVFVSDRDEYVSNLKPLGQVFWAHFGDHHPAMALFEVSAFFRAGNMIELEGMAVIR